MGVISPYKTFTFGGESSADYGVYLTGEGVFNAPERSVEMVEIPGRNGNFALDKGKFENIEVTYRVGMFDDDEENFADKVSAFRNWLCSKVGYVRLSDDYNPNEYRMAVYSGGVELEHDFLIAGEAEITFDCKPQRWLTSGETAVSVADGGTLSNPTLFESEPLLAVKGYGNINFNGYDIDIANVVMGETMLLNSMTRTGRSTQWSFKDGLVNNNDAITANGVTFSVIFIRAKLGSITIPTISNTNANFSAIGSDISTSSNDRIKVVVSANPLAYSAGTDSTITNTVSASNGTITFSFTTSLRYEASTRMFYITISVPTTSWSSNFVYTVAWDSIMADSTVSVLGHPTYIDCDIGECYMIKNGEIITLNTAIDLGSDLPKLVSGTNTINYDNTITSLEVTPRWWKV